MLVYVINKNGNKLMPCKPAKARHLIEDEKAHVINREPFTIQLNWDCEENIQNVTLGIDKGSSYTGFSSVGNNKILMSGILHHRLDIKRKMDSRRRNRKNRRGRGWHRKPKVDNRASSKRSGRLPPSTRANAEEVVRVANKIPLPISHIVIEDLLVDIANLERQKINTEDNRLDENIRLATLMRDGFKCIQCGKTECKLQVHHIIFKNRGGSDSIYNLISLCKKCHEDVHNGKIIINGGASGFRDRTTQRTMRGKTHLYENLIKIADLDKVFGNQTSEYRKSLGLQKDHDIDALCIATLLTKDIIEYDRHNFYNITFRPRQTRRQYLDLPQKGLGRVRYQKNEESGGLHKGDIVKVKGKYIKQIYSIYSNGRVAFRRVKGEPDAARPKDCRLLRKSQTIIWQKSV